MSSRLNYRRFPRRDKEPSSDRIEFSEDKSTAERVLEILQNVCIKPGVSSKKKTLYLSKFTQLLCSCDHSNGTADLGLRLKEIMLCLRLPLLSDNQEVRTAALRTLRYLIKNNQDAASVISVNLHLLLVRILDLNSETRTERLQVVKLARKLLIYGPQNFPVILVKSLISLGQKNVKHKDTLRRASIAVLCELSCLAPHLFISSGCVRYLSNTLLDCENLPRIIESIIGCLMRIYNHPALRRESGLDLANIVSPFTELHLHSEMTASDEGRLASASTALLALLRSWPGLLLISNPSFPSKPLESLIEILHVQTHQSKKISYETRKIVLDVIFKSLSLQVPDWTEEFDVAMKTADPSAPKDSWKLGEGFVASEGRDILPHLSKSRPNLLENHCCVLLSCYLQCKLPQALVQVIVSSDTVLSVRSTVLLGHILHLATLLLPHEIGSISQCLPELAEHISINNPVYNKSESNRAISAVTALQRFHSLKKCGPRPQSLLLEQAVHSSGQFQGEGFVGDKLSLPAPSLISGPQSHSSSVVVDHATLHSMKETQVILNRDPQSWQWEIVLSILRCPGDGLKRLEDTNCKIFIKKITEYFKPSSNMFSRLELETDRTRQQGRIGCCLLDFLVNSVTYNLDIDRRGLEPESSLLLDDLLADIFKCVQEVIDASSPHDCMFSPTRLSNTACQLYFLFIGRLTSSEQGRVFLERHQCLSLLMSLLTSRMDVYLKLIISAVDYRTVDCRVLLTKALSGYSEAGRIYTIRWLGVLARIGATSFAQYGVELLVDQLKDSSLQVSVSALTVLEEVCDDKMYLESLVAAKSSLFSESGQKALARLGGRGRILLTRFLGSGSGFNLMYSNNWLSKELIYWADSFNKQYVVMVEGLINDGFTEHQRSLEGMGGYGRRSGDGHITNDVFVPPHLYGQLAQTRAGFDVLLAEKSFWSMIELLRDLENSEFLSCTSRPTDSFVGLEETWLYVKAAIWGLCHVATSCIGAEELEKEGVISNLVNIAESCSVLSIKGTAYYALGLVATTRTGTSCLGHRGWATVRHARSETWPITFEWLGASDNLFPSYFEESLRFSQESPAPSESMYEDATVWSPESRFLSESSKQSEPKQRRIKTTSECTDSSLSQNMLELGPSPLEPSFPLPGKLGEKFSNWFSSSAGGNGKHSSGKTEVKNGTGRRFSEGGKSGSSFSSKLRNSFNRKRSKTISAGCTPSREGTPVSSAERTEEKSADAGDNVVRRLSFSQEDSSSSAVAGAAASPDVMPGEIFHLENIVEEPGNHQAGDKTRKCDKQISEEEKTSAKGVVDQVEQLDESLGSSTGQQLDTSVVSSSSVKEPSRSTEIQITFSAQKFDNVQSSIKQGTSVSSVSSMGSFTFKDNYGQGSLARNRIKRRPQLSESEDGDTLHGSQAPSISQDIYAAKTKSLDYRMIRGTGIRKNYVEPFRSLSVPPRPVGSSPRYDTAKEPSYWGIAYPLHHQILYPEPSQKMSSPRLELTRIVGSWLNTPSRHVATTCLSCCRLRPSARPRAASLTVSIDDPRSSFLLSTSLPSSQQSPETKRKSWNPTTDNGSDSANLQSNPDSPELPLNYDDAKVEAMELICQLNFVFRYKQSESGLNKLKNKIPKLFQDLCFYSDVCQALGDYDFNVNARKFIQVLFVSLDITQMENEARNILTPEENLQKS